MAERPEERAHPFRLRGDQLAGAAALVGVAAILLYLVGGAVQWARFHDAGLEPSFALTRTDPRTFAVIGLTGLILPVVSSVLFTGIFLAVLSRTSAVPPLTISEAKRRRALRIINGAMVLAGVVGVVFLLPLGWAGVGVVAGVVNGWVIGGAVNKEVQPGGPLVPPHVWRVVAVLLVTLPIATLARELQGPSQLDRVTVQTSDGETDRGYLVDTTAEFIYVGIRENVVAIPVASVTRFEVKKPPPLETPGTLWDRYGGWFEDSVTGVVTDASRDPR